MTTETTLERTVREEQEAHDAHVEPRRQNVETDDPVEVDDDTPTDDPEQPVEEDGQTAAAWAQDA